MIYIDTKQHTDTAEVTLPASLSRKHPREALTSRDGTAFLNGLWKSQLELKDVTLVLPKGALEAFGPHVAGILSTIPRKDPIRVSCTHTAKEPMCYRDWAGRRVA